MDLHDHLLTRRELLKQERDRWVPHWRKVQEFISPRRGSFLVNDRNRTPRFTNIIDNTGTMASRNLAAGMMAGVTSPARKWFKLGFNDDSFNEFGPIKTWLSQVENVLYEIFRQSNFYNAMHMLYGELGDFGNGGKLILPDFDNVIHCYQLPVGSHMIDINDKGSVDTVYRDIPMTVKQIVGKFGKKNLPRTVLQDWDKSNYNNEYTVYHAIEPSNEIQQDLGVARRFAFASIYWIEGDLREQRNPLRVSGFNEFSGMFPRWDLLAGDTYGSGPGSVALGDVKQLQTEQKQKGQAIAKHVNPPLQAPGGMEGTPVSSLPGGVTYHKGVSPGGEKVEAIYQVKPQLRDMQIDIAEVQQRIKRAYYEDLFLMLANSDRREITAREIEEKHEEKLLMLGPVLERLNTELLDPVIERVFNIANRAGIIPPPPERISRQAMKVEYISIMAQAQKAVGVTSIEQTLGFVGNLAGVNPDVLDKVDMDQAVDEYAGMVGVPPTIIRSDDEVADIRAEREARQQAADAMAAAAEGAKTAELLSKTDTGPGNALGDILAGGMQ
ncbi:MAG: hypothetical protein DBP02_02115 [gamma proteobacterium symbiont of Ctena orbiculata]|nr:MAG: hypothetical protein DBP02_02115 [gamma proteobacterium symbiont of Ctena orbiculata]